MLRILIACWALSVVGSLPAETVAGDLAYAMSTRYAPYANWESRVDVDLLARQSVPSYWKSIAEIRSLEANCEAPLAGLHVALDPGHVGGRWAPYEGRDFAIAEGDFRVREGELVLVIAQSIREQLEALGAQVTLLREGIQPINPRSPVDYLEVASSEVAKPTEQSFESLWSYGQAMRSRAIRHSVIVGEIAERARVVNEVVKPDVLLSLHINAATWPSVKAGGVEGELTLVESNNVHVLVFGCMSDHELSQPRQQEQLMVKLLNGSADDEFLLGSALGAELADASGLPAAVYQGQNAVQLASDAPTLWARNLLLLRMAQCPTVMLEPYIANSKAAYPRLQQALSARANSSELPEDDILVEYADAVTAGLLRVYAK